MDIIFLPKHVSYGMKMCGVDIADVINALKKKEYKIAKEYINKLSKIDVNDMVKLNKFLDSILLGNSEYQSLAKEDLEKCTNDYFQEISVNDIREMLTDDFDKESFLKNKHNILSSNVMSGNLNGVSTWINFRRVNDFFIITVDDEYLRFLIDNRTEALLLFYRLFINNTYRQFGLEIFNLEYFKYFLKFINKTTRK
jgi:hypothetical protein